MTQQEYEQKRRECWEKFCRANPSHNKSIFARKVFDFAFDRAYALGKQTEIISQEEIEKMAWDYAKDTYYPTPDYGWYESDDEQMKEVLENTFKAGANFALGKQESKQESKQETVIQGWAARDESGLLNFFYGGSVPYKNDNDGDWNTAFGRVLEYLPREMFPDLTWESDPIEVEIIIKRKKK
jgi:hypothetical protein